MKAITPEIQFQNNSRPFSIEEKETKFTPLKWTRETQNATQRRIGAPIKQQVSKRQMKAIKKIVQLQLIDKKNDIDSFRQLPIIY